MTLVQMPPHSIRVMLVDDHSVVRSGFKLLIDATPNMQVVAEAATGEEAVQSFRQNRPDVIILDLSMPGIGGFEALTRMLSKDPGACILVLSAHQDGMYARRALNAGALGYLTKRSVAGALIDAIRQVHRRKIFLEPDIARQLAVQNACGSRDRLDVLTCKEFKVFLALAEGHSVQKIAGVMSLSPRTIGTHLYNIKQKLGVSTSAEIALTAMRAGLLSL
jgi:two-component system invasion response regulator UvrY